MELVVGDIATLTEATSLRSLFADLDQLYTLVMKTCGRKHGRGTVGFFRRICHFGSSFGCHTLG